MTSPSPLSETPEPRNDGAPSSRLKRRRIGDVLLTTLFLVAITVPLIATVADYRPNNQTRDHRPNRPKLTDVRSPRDAVAFPGLFRSWFNQSFALRDVMLEAYGRMLATGLDSSASPKVVRGKDRWLFLRSEGAMDGARRLDPYEPQEVVAMVNAVRREAAVATDREAEFYFLIAPDKHTVYPDMLPDALRRREAPSRSDQLHRAILDDPIVGTSLIDVRPPFVNAMRDEDAKYFHYTDTHWNAKGAYEAYLVFLKQLAHWNLPQLQPVTSTTETVPGGDLARMLGLKHVLQEPFPTLTFDEHRDVMDADGSTLQAPGLDGQELSLGRIETTCESGEIPYGIILHDSFGNMMVPMLARHFKRAVFIRTATIDAESMRRLIEAEAPGADVILHEIVERRLMTLKPAVAPDPAD